MSASTAVLASEHRGIETALDNLAEALSSGTVDGGRLAEIAALVSRHYAGEREFLARLAEHEPRLAAKLAAQHEEALELAASLEESLESGQFRDAGYLARRYLAIVRHNIIEEERDIFPLAERCFLGGE